MKNRMHYDVITGLFILVLSIVFYFMSTDFPQEGKLFPVTVIALLAFFGILITISGVKKTVSNTQKNLDTMNDDVDGMSAERMKIPFIILITIIIYIAIIGIIGFFVSTILFLMVVLLVLKVRGMKGYVYTVLGTNLFLYILFVMLLHVSLPKGILF